MEALPFLHSFMDTSSLPVKTLVDFLVASLPEKKNLILANVRISSLIGRSQPRK